MFEGIFKSRNEEVVPVVYSEEDYKKLERKIEAQKERIESLEKQNWLCEQKAIVREQRVALDIEAAKNEVRATLQEALVESDMKRVSAESTLAAYKETDTKSDRLELNAMLKTAVGGLIEAVKTVQPAPTINVAK